MVAKFTPFFFHWYEYGVVPPVTVASIEPFVPPLQLTFTFVDVAVNAAGEVTFAVKTSVQPFASVTVAVYVPAAKFEMFAVVAPVDHK